MCVMVAHERTVAVAFATATARRTSVEGTFTRERPRRSEGGAAVPVSAERTEEVDPGVLTAAQHGDDEAFVDIIRHYDRRLRIVAFHVLNDRQLMDDVLQDVTLRVYRSLSRFRGESSLGTWLCRITYRACCDAMTRAGRLRALPLDGLPDLPDPAPAGRRRRRDRLAGRSPPAAGQRLAVLLVDREATTTRRRPPSSGCRRDARVTTQHRPGELRCCLDHRRTRGGLTDGRDATPNSVELEICRADHGPSTGGRWACASPRPRRTLGGPASATGWRGRSRVVTPWRWRLPPSPQ
jgi:RNA polymerase sigma factor (sigma-70 family)